MAKWWVFPPRARVRLFFRRDESGIRYIVRSLDQRNPGLNPGSWREIEGGLGAWISEAGRQPAVPTAKWKAMGASVEDLDPGSIRRRYQLRNCPDQAVQIGANHLGDEVREHDGRRWIMKAGLAYSDSWAGDETAHPPAWSLRFGTARAWPALARRIVGLASRGQFALDDEELARLAAAVVDPGRRPSFQPWTEDAEESKQMLLKELRSALLAPAAEAARPVWAEAAALERAIPSLATGDGTQPSLTVSAAVAGLAGPLRQASLTGPAGDAPWAGLFGDANSDTAVIDARRMTAATGMQLMLEHSDDRPGRVVAMLPGDPDHPDIQHGLTSVSLQRGIESILHLPSEVLPEEAGGLTLIAAGIRRPEVLAEPPPQALRVIRGEVRNDLRRWLDEGLRGRARLAGEEASASRQAPYVPVSRIGQARCTIARGHQTAAAVAGRNLVARRGPVDDYVAGLLGTDRAGMEARYSPEQIDAIGMAEDAHQRGRAFLLADQTGTGKGRSAAGMAGSWLRADPANRVVYLTVSNVGGDVIRDLRNTAAIEEAGRPILLANNMPGLDDAYTPAEAVRREIYESLDLPEGARFVVATYASLQLAAAGDQTRTEAERRAAEWFVAVASDPSTMVILDEAHSALNPESNLGTTIRTGIAGAGRVAFVTATAMRTPEGVDLYRRVMPPGLRGERFDRQIVKALQTVGETAQESLIAMLTEDGVMLRRDHDSGLVPYTVDTPAGEEEQRASAVMASVSAVAERMMELSREVRRWYSAARNPYAALARGDGPAARHAGRQLEQMMPGGFGGPMDQIARSVLVSLKVEQAARLAVSELRERGRKPMISISSTNGEFLRRIHNGEAGIPDDRQLDIRDLVRHVAGRLCVIKGLGEVYNLGGIRVEGDSLDLRGHSRAVQDLWEELSQTIEAMPPGLPVSPADALVAGLAAEGVSAAEITGREHCVTADGTVTRREIRPKDEIARQYNDGEIDVLIYNQAGGTGASYHASAEFGDQRPRSILQLELPLDVLRHLQSMGRGNRFDQVSLPHFMTLSTDTLAEQRLLAMNNRKLRTVGAILDGNRDHPALATDVPDIFNSVGERACASLIEADQVLAARLDLTPRSKNLAKSIFTRALLLDEAEQERLFGMLVSEYEAQLAEAEAQGRNPLKVPSLPGYVEIMSTQPFATDTQEVLPGEEQSVFDRDMTLSTGIWHRPPGLPASAVAAAAVEASEGQGRGGCPAAAAAARDLSARWEAVNRNMTREDLQALIDLLESFEPGRILRPAGDPHQYMVAVEYFPPERLMADRSFGHRFRCIAPGDGGFRIWSAAELIKENLAPRQQNILDADASLIGSRFDAYATTANRRAVQILSGDMLSVGRTVGQSGSQSFRVCTFNDQSGASRRAAVNSSDLKKLDLNRMQFRISAASLLDAAVDKVGNKAYNQLLPVLPRAGQETKDGRLSTESTYRPWLINISLRWDERPVFRAGLPSRSARNMQSFWSVGTGPEIYRTATGSELSKPSRTADARRRVSIDFDATSEGEIARARRLCALIDRHPATDLLAPGQMRDWWVERGRQQAQSRKPVFEPLAGGGSGLGDRVDKAATGAAPAVAARVTWPAGELTIEAVPGGGSDRQGSVMTLPACNRKAGSFWSGPAGREILETVFGEAAGDAAALARPHTVFLDRERTSRVCSLLDEKANSDTGWSIDIVRGPPEAESAPDAGMAA